LSLPLHGQRCVEKTTPWPGQKLPMAAIALIVSYMQNGELRPD
jgi:hypothetical protein